MVVKEFLEGIEDDEDRGLALGAWKWVKRGTYGLAAVIALLTSFYTVPTDSVGVVKRFGAYSRTTEPGIHFKVPCWVETVQRVPVKKVQKEELGFRTLKAGVSSQYLGIEEVDLAKVDERVLENLVKADWEEVSDPSASNRDKIREILKKEYIMLTGDLNIADVEWVVQYKIKDAKDYLFNIRDPKKTIRDVSQAVMRQLIGNGSIDEAITIGRGEYEVEAKESLQKLLDDYQTGIHVVTIKLQSSNPPTRVRPAFNEVNRSLQQKEQRINEAMKAYNEVIPRTVGEAKQMIEQSKGYAARRVNEAKGDVGKFGRIYGQYQKAPEITRQRMYLEAMNRLLPQIPEKWIIDGEDARGILPLLKLNPEQKSE